MKKKKTESYYHCFAPYVIRATFDKRNGVRTHSHTAPNTQASADTQNKRNNESNSKRERERPFNHSSHRFKPTILCCSLVLACLASCIARYLVEWTRFTLQRNEGKRNTVRVFDYTATQSVRWRFWLSILRLYAYRIMFCLCAHTNTQP